MILLLDFLRPFISAGLVLKHRNILKLFVVSWAKTSDIQSTLTPPFEALKLSLMLLLNLQIFIKDRSFQVKVLQIRR